MLQSMPRHYENIKPEFIEWLYKLYHLKINKISVFQAYWHIQVL